MAARLTSIVHESTKNLFPLKPFFPGSVSGLAERKVDRDFTLTITQKFGFVGAVRKEEKSHKCQETCGNAFHDEENPPRANRTFRLGDAVRQSPTVCVRR